jgi:hypothetical protein
MRKRFGLGGIVGVILFIASFVRPILAAWGQARLVDQFLTPRVAPYVTNTNLLYVGLVGLILILIELRQGTKAAPASDAGTSISTPTLATNVPSQPPGSSPLDASTSDGEKELAILQMFVEFVDKHTVEDVAKRRAMSTHLAGYHLDRLRGMHLILHSFDEYRNGREVFIISREGRDLLARLNLLK